MQTKFIFTIALVTVSLMLSAQNTKGKIDKATTHPQAKENAAKADLYILEKKIFDSASVKNNKQPVGNKRKKKNGCGNKCSR